MIFSWISWLSTLPCVFGSLFSTKVWITVFETEWVRVCVSIYLLINFLSWLLVKELYGALIIKEKDAIENKQRSHLKENPERNTYQIALPEILVYKSEENDEIDETGKSFAYDDEDHYSMKPILESDAIDHSESTSNHKLKVTANMVVAAIAFQSDSINSSANRNKNTEESDTHIKSQVKKGEISKLHQEQRMAGMIHVPGISKPNHSNLSPQKHHLGAKDKHGGRSMDGKRMNKGQGKGMRAGGRMGGVGYLNNSTTTNNNYEGSESTEGEMFDFVVDVGGILDDQFESFNELQEELSPNRSFDKDGGSSDSKRRRKGSRGRAESFSTLLVVADSEESGKSQVKKSDLLRNKKAGMQSRSARNLSSAGMQEHYLSDVPIRKKERKLSDQGGSGSSSSKRQTKKDSSHQKTKMPKSRSRK
jgi:hypothetical protein